MTVVTNPKLANTVLWLLLMIITFYLLIIGQQLLIPLVLAVFIWYLINVLADYFTRIPLGHYRLPMGLAYLLSGITIVLMLNAIGGLIGNNIAGVAGASPEYQQNLSRISKHVLSWLPIDMDPILDKLLADISFGSLVARIAAGIGGLLGNLSLIAVYLLFIFLEQRYFHAKLTSVVGDPQRTAHVQKILARIDHDIRTYVGIKTFVSLLTASISYGIMKTIGLDFAEFWALLIFVFNFIPNIGSLISTSLPALLALVQFQTAGPFATIAIGVGLTQLTVGNVLEPRMMGQSLNMSPLVIMLSLVLWGSVWGIPGMFLCVPITVIAMIILNHFQQTRWIALLLSQDGKLKH